MGRDFLTTEKLSIPPWITLSQFGFQMGQLESQLPLGDGQRPGLPSPGNLGGIEGIPSPHGFVMDRPQIGRDRCQRCSALPEPGKLWMRTVALRLALQHLLGKQGFSPKGNQALLIEE